MNKLLSIGCVLALAAAAFAEDPANAILVKPGSAKGFIAIVDTQTKIDQKELVDVVNLIRKDRRFVFKFFNKESDVKDVPLLVRIVDEPGKPPMTVSPEIGRGEMNVAALVTDLKSEKAKKKFLVSRARRVLMRTIAYTLGAGGTKYDGNIMTSPILRELDYYNEALPADTLESFARNARKFGLKPEYTASYEVACEEGWAPQPTNDVQKAIWKEIHTPPSNPIKIKFDPAKKAAK